MMSVSGCGYAERTSRGRDAVTAVVKYLIKTVLTAVVV